MNILSFNLVAENIKKEIARRCGLNMSQTRILLYFYQTKNTALKMGNLAGDLKISLSTLSRQLQQKKTRSLICVTRSATDSSKSVALSPEGLMKAAELRLVLAAIEEKMMGDFSQQEIGGFNRVFDKLIQKIKEENSI